MSLKLIIMSLVLDTLIEGKTHHTKIQSHQPQAHADAPPLLEDL